MGSASRSCWESLPSRIERTAVWFSRLTSPTASAPRRIRTLLLELQTALAKVKTLQGWIRICANCKRVLNDAGVWEQFEAYVHAHSGVDFSHGICPDCATKWAADV